MPKDGQQESLILPRACFFSRRRAPRTSDKTLMGDLGIIKKQHGPDARLEDNLIAEMTLVIGP